MFGKENKASEKRDTPSVNRSKWKKGNLYV